jgi:hypothetical protein
MEFPDVYTSDFKAEKFKLAKEAIDYAVSHYESTSGFRNALSKIYDSYNGIVDPKKHESITKPFGKESKTKYIHYNYGLNKAKTLVGEYLATDIDPRVETIDEDNIAKKYKKYLMHKAFLEIKEELLLMKENGYDVFPGMIEEMHNEKHFLAPENFKTENERLLTKYLVDKIKKDKLKLKFRQVLVDSINTCILFGKVDTVNGMDTFRRISPLNALFMDMDTEGFLEDSPYIGEKRLMHYHQVIKEFDIDSSEKELHEKIREMARLEGLTDSEARAGVNKNKGLLIPVYTIEFKTMANVTYFKRDKREGSIIREISNEDYLKRKKQYEADQKNGKIEIIRVISEEVWEISRIGKDIYRNIRRVPKQISTLENKKLRARYDYVIMLTDTVEGMRIPIQHIISKLDDAYNDVMFLINKELRKPNGDAMGINMGLLPHKVGYNDVMHDVYDDGVVQFNTAAEGNQGNIEGRGGETAISAVNVGDKARVIDVLIRLKADLENAQDRITGITRGRVGMERATTTATGANNNLEASRTVTYDLFFNAKEFTDEVMTRLCEKGKLNFVENNPEIFGGVFDEEEFEFINATADVVFENFVAYINDGRKEMQIREKIESLFPMDIQAGNLRTKDIMKFYLQDTLANGLKVLDKATEEITKINQQAEQSKNETMMKMKEMDKQMHDEEREDYQAHEIEKIVTKGEIDKEIMHIDKSYDQAKANNANETKKAVTDKKNFSDERREALKNRLNQNKNKNN